ncbi:putative bifunctional diguanylate cyclase/phosphodiesterase [Frankia gtarii]|uniref:putative bifunctional diguanylate cyclase/phosphodiesterase n=1 Tax=Frankia gtarii TaxID=2950102 RepID=UPI0027DFC104|nr:bifunctional diguanylate cyclase/phosphodiesterase [Frankia gtarii]
MVVLLLLIVLLLIVLALAVGFVRPPGLPGSAGDAGGRAGAVVISLAAVTAVTAVTAVAAVLIPVARPGIAREPAGTGWAPWRARRRRWAGDELTGLADRRHFLDAVGRSLGGGHRVRAVTPVAVLLLDLDRMRDVNGALGHDQGDRLLVTVGRRLLAALPGSTLLARVDGDAFAVLLRGGVESAERLATVLREALEPPVLLAGAPVRPDASIGIACSPEHGRAALELFRHAEEAMHDAKRSRCGQSVYARAHPPINRARLLLRAEIRQALDCGQLELSYQPKADLRSGRISGVEALVRWRHPVDGVRPPDVFLAELDRAGLMPKLTVYVLDQALTACAGWHAGGAPLTVSVNVPASVIVDRAFLGVVRAALARHRLPPSALVIEVTEDSLIEAREAARHTLTGLRSLGVRVSLDDYGTGFCSLTYLRELPADEVKLDRTFLRDLDRDPAAVEIVRSTVSLAHALRMRIVAEGVETQRSWQALADWQCDEVQGYFVAGPMAGDRVVGWLREWAARLTVPPGSGTAAAGVLVGAGVAPGAAAAAIPALAAPPSATAPVPRPGQWPPGLRGTPAPAAAWRTAGYRVQTDLAAS